MRDKKERGRSTRRRGGKKREKEKWREKESAERKRDQENKNFLTTPNKLKIQYTQALYGLT